MRLVAGVVVSVTGLVALVVCAEPRAPLPGLTASTTMSAESSATPSPSPTVDYSDPELGIVFEDDTDLTGDEAEVYHWAPVYETEYWRTMTTNTVSPKFTTIASPEVQVLMQQIADGNAAVQLEVGGRFHVQLREIVVEGDTARAVACVDYRDVTATDPNGTYTAAEVGFGETTREELALARVAERTWIVLTSTVSAGC